MDGGFFLQKLAENRAAVDKLDFHRSGVPTAEFTRAAKELGTAYSNDETMESLMRQLRRNTKSLVKTIVVAHSQGNMYAAAALTLRRQDEPAVDDGMAVHIGVASPGVASVNFLPFLYRQMLKKLERNKVS